MEGSKVKIVCCPKGLSSPPSESKNYTIVGLLRLCELHLDIALILQVARLLKLMPDSPITDHSNVALAVAIQSSALEGVGDWSSPPCSDFPARSLQTSSVSVHVPNLLTLRTSAYSSRIELAAPCTAPT